ncbi:MAG: hypothetical protein ACLSGI_07950 [Butyricicoccaceae bacterium]
MKNIYWRRSGHDKLRAILFDSEQKILAIRQHELTQHYLHEDGRAGPDGNLVHTVCSYARGAGGRRCFSVRWAGTASPTSARRPS